MGPHALASYFDMQAGSFLSDQGCVLTNNPDVLIGPYQCSRAEYKSNAGLFVAVGFDPLDGRSATILCGRKWRYAPVSPDSQGVERLSNLYCLLARRFGFELPSNYELYPGDAAERIIYRIVDDLKLSLPTVLGKVSLNDLISVEGEKFGAQWYETQYGNEHGRAGRATITAFPE